MASNIVLKAIGLNTQPNNLDQQSTPPGSLLVASDVIIRRDNTVESRRGYPLYGTSFGTGSDRAKQLMTYKGRIIRHFSNKLQYDTLVLNALGQSIFNTFCGSFLEPQVGRRIRYIESNGNLYFTTSEGIQKISAKTAAGFTTACPFIIPAGGIAALDVSTRLDIILGNETGFLPQDSAVAYRIVWGSNDANGNEILGAPSQRSVIYNPLINLELLDFNNLLLQLDNVSDNAAFPSIINDGNYFSTLSLSGSASATDLQNNLVLLAEKIDNDIQLADTVAATPLQINGASINNGIGTISFSSGNPANYFISGDVVNLVGFTPTTGTLNTVANAQGVLTGQTISTVVPAFSTTGNTTVGAQEITNVATNPDVGGSLTGVYFLINSADNVNLYYVWINVDNTGTDPMVSGRTGIRVNIATGATATAVATAIASAVNGFNGDFTVTSLGSAVTITNSIVGATDPSQAGTSGFFVTPTQMGVDANVITSIASTTGIQIGSIITDTGGAIPAFTYVTAIGIGTITISNNATATVPGDTLNFAAGINFNTTATGPVTFLNPTINDYNYETIPQPAAPDLPPTDSELVALQTYLQAIITQLQSEPNTGTPPIISSDSQTKFISPIQITNSANVFVTFTVPPGVTTNNFYQIYRSPIAQATGTQVLETDVFPNDELQLVFEGFPTSAQIAAGTITVLDITPQEFAGAFLYTNATTGSGILQANNPPPFALDINIFKNCVFYANTSTLFSTSLNLLGVAQMITDIEGGGHPSITITNGVSTETFFFVLGEQEITNITTVADVAGSLAGKYFTLNSAQDQNQYYFWYVVSGSGTDPMVAGKTGIQININTGDSANTVAAKTLNVINSLILDFTATISTNTITVTTVDEGITTDGTAGTSGFTVVVTQQGAGANPALKQVLLSNNVSPGVAINETAQSLIAVINAQPNGIVSAFNLSDIQSVPGQIFLQARTLGEPAFYVVANNSSTGASFNPDISPAFTITSNTAANPTVVTTSVPHGFTDNEQVVISGSNSTPSIDGLYNITYISPTTFSVPVNVTVAGTRGAVTPSADVLTADNLAMGNRIYYSKLLQPEAVPLVNFIDVGAQDQPILRIFPLRDSLFVYKSDGLYRISGEVAPFNLALFDLSCILLAPDSLDVSNNLIYGWTTQGITSTSESGTNIISRPIDVDILPKATPQYINFLSATWGIGYESDNSYTTYTVSAFDDVYATIAYRYSTLTNTWTTFDKTDNCGVINQTDDRQYLGAGDTNFLEQERKNFDRTDYSDREFVQEITLTNLAQNKIILQDITKAAVGDVITQDQFMTVFNFNSLLSKLDTDHSLSPHNYVSTLTMSAGQDGRTMLDALIAKIAADPGRVAKPGADPGSDYTQYEAINGSFTVTNMTATSPTILTTSAPSGLTTGRTVTIEGSNSTPSVDGVYQVTVISPTTFSIPVNVTNNGITAITNISIANPTVVTSADHGLISGDQILIRGSNSTPSINGLRTVTVINSDTFTVPVNVTVAGTTGSWIPNIEFTVNNENFLDIEASYNGVITTLNNDPGVSFSNYQQITYDTLQEVIITAVNVATKTVTVNLILDFIVGPITIYKAIPSLIQYSPQDMQDPLSFKHFSDALLFFENKAFTSATLSFASDLLPAFQSVPVLGMGNGIFGYTGIPDPVNGVSGPPGFGYGFFGGGGNAAPFRTYVPRNAQRCRFLNIQFGHQVAREKWSLQGCVVVGVNTQSSRVYR